MRNNSHLIGVAEIDTEMQVVPPSPTRPPGGSDGFPPRGPDGFPPGVLKGFPDWVKLIDGKRTASLILPWIQSS